MTDVAFDAVTVAYGDVVALKALDLQVASGELVVLVGPSGSGKSTALRALAGLEPTTSGRVLIGGKDVTGAPPHQRGAAMVFQDYALYPHLTARENLAFGPRVRKERASEDRIPAVAEQLGISDILDRYPDQMSGGQRQRVALARAMVREPAVYLMDEPLSNLDAQLRLTTRADIVELHRRLGTTTIYVTHDQAEAMTMGDRVAVLHDGRLQQVAAPEAMYDRPANRFVAGFLGSPSMNFVAGGGILGGSPGTDVGVRPEDLHVAADGAIEVTVVVVEALGSETILAVTTQQGLHLSIRTPPRAGYRTGDVLRVNPDPSRLHHFDGDTGARLP